MTVFRMRMQRPAFSVLNDSVYHLKDDFLCSYSYSTKKDTQVIRIGEPTLAYSCLPVMTTFSCSSHENNNALLIWLEDDCGTYRLVVLNANDSTGRYEMRGHGRLAIFVAPDRFAVMEKLGNLLLVKNLENEIVTGTCLLVLATAFFYAGRLNLLCKTEENRIVMFDLQQKMIVADLEICFVKYVVWADDMEPVALVSGHSITITNRKLVRQCTVYERESIESEAWDDVNCVFIYNAMRHIKYCVVNGETGFVMTSGAPLYLTRVVGSTICCLDENARSIVALVVDAIEYLLKSSLLKEDHNRVLNSMVKSPELCGGTMSPKRTEGLVMRRRGRKQVFVFPPAVDEKYEDHVKECTDVNS